MSSDISMTSSLWILQWHVSYLCHHPFSLNTKMTYVSYVTSLMTYYDIICFHRSFKVLTAFSSTIKIIVTSPLWIFTVLSLNSSTIKFEFSWVTVKFYFTLFIYSKTSWNYLGFATCFSINSSFCHNKTKLYFLDTRFLLTCF